MAARLEVNGCRDLLRDLKQLSAIRRNMMLERLKVVNVW